MRIKDVMTSPVVSITEAAPLSDAITLMIQDHLSGLPVLDAIGQLSGVLSEGDLLRRVELGSGAADASWWSWLLSSRQLAETYRRTNGHRVADVMTRAPVTIGENDTLNDAARLMQKHRIKRLPVMREGCLVGMLSRADFVKALRGFIAPTYEEAVISDGEIKARILAELAHQDWAVNCEVGVAVHQGRVVLTGSVPSHDHRASARIAAENVFGVVSVNDRLNVMEPVCVPGF